MIGEPVARPPRARARPAAAIAAALLTLALVAGALGSAAWLLERTLAVRCRYFLDSSNGHNIECRFLRRK